MSGLVVDSDYSGLTRAERRTLKAADRIEARAAALRAPVEARRAALARRGEGLGPEDQAVLREAAGMVRHAAQLRRPVEAAALARRERAEAERALADQAALEAAREGGSARREGTAQRLVTRDGLRSLYESGTLSEAQWKAGMAYRLLYEAGAERSRSQLEERVGGGGSGTSDGHVARALLTAYAGVRLTAVERAVAAAHGGRAVNLLRAVAGQGWTVRAVAPAGGSAAKSARTRLAAALDVVAGVLWEKSSGRVANQSRLSA